MAINRLLPLSGVVPQAWGDQLDRYFGTEDWREVAYSRKADLFGEANVKNTGVADRLLDLYLKRLATIFPCVGKPYLIRNTRQSPLYHLIWAGPHPLGKKIMGDILDRLSRRTSSPRRG